MTGFFAVSLVFSAVMGLVHRKALTRALADEGDDHAGQARAEVSSTPDRLLAGLDHYSGCVAAMRAGLSLDPTGRRPTSRRLIPVRS